MYRRSLSNLLGGSLLVATAIALNACGGAAAPGDMTPSAGTTGAPSGNAAGTPGSTATAGKTGGTPTTTGTAGTKATAGTMSTTSGVMTAAGKSGGTAGTASATAGSGAAGSGTATAAAGGAATATAGTSGGAAGGGMAAAGGAAMAGTLGGPLKYTGMFTMGTMIERKYKCPTMGDNKSPPLSWTGGPADTKSFALVLFDTGFGFLHYALWDIPATVNELPEGLASGYNLMNPMGAHQAAAMCNNAPAYCGPCSGMGLPASDYEYRLYALKTDKLMLTEMSTAAQAQAAIEAAKLEMVVWKGKPVSM